MCFTNLSEFAENGWHVENIVYKTKLFFFFYYLMFFLAFYKLLSSCSVWSRTWCIPWFSCFARARLSVMKSSSTYRIVSDQVNCEHKYNRK